MRRSRVFVSALVDQAVAGASTGVELAARDNIQSSERCTVVKARRAIVEVSKSSPVMAIIGVSPAADGLTDKTEACAYSVGAHVAGEGMISLMNGAYCRDHSFAERNDWETPAQLRLEATQLLEGAPALQCVVLIEPDVPGRNTGAVVAEALSRAAADASAENFSALDWDLGFLPDVVHITEANYPECGVNVLKALG